MSLQTAPNTHHPMKLRRVIMLSASTTLVLSAITVAAVKLSSPATPMKYLTASVTKGKASLTDSATGDITPQQTDVVTLPVSGQIIRLNVGIGEQVTSGQTLALFGDPVLYTQLAKDRANVLSDQAQATLDMSSGYRNLENAAVTQAQDNLTAAEDTLAVDEANAQVRATTSGTITWKVAAGAPVSPGEIVATIGGTPIAAPIGGILSSLTVGSGGTASSGQVLATMDSTAESIKILGDRSQIASLQSALDKAEASVGQNAATIAQAQANLQESQQAYAAAKAAVTGLTATAPYAGEITAVNPSAIGGTKVITEFSASMVAVIAVPETQINAIHTGQPVQITLPALAGKTFTGTVSSIAPVGTYSNGVSNFPVTVSVNNPVGIRYGMSAQVNIVIRTVNASLLVPLAAIHSHGNHGFVDVLSGNTPHRVPVKIVLENATTAAVKSKHLRPGERVVTAVLSAPSGKLHLKARGRALHHAKRGNGGGRKKAKA